jgi:hypothetical protein
MIDAGFWPGLRAGDPTVIVFNNTAVASNPAAGPGWLIARGMVRRTLLTDENVEEAGMRLDRLTLAGDASFLFEPSARSMVWFQVLEGDAKLKWRPEAVEFASALSDRHSVFLPPAFDHAIDRTSAEPLTTARPSGEYAGRVFAARRNTGCRTV